MIRSTDRGYVSAETAVVLPALVLVLVLVLWGVNAGLAQIRCVDAARAGARGLARGESQAASVAAAYAAAPAGARISVATGGDQMRVEVRVEIHPPGVFGARLPGLPVRGTAVAAREPTGPGAP
ncbi:hypothetical protein C3Y87_08295 [Carbonactinospora thermoautotrophica]|uniref:TadE-like domain-containing protein n=1 Tax=Carbonactinospora thermoautotrophica TaxID=1469144 RepID=A0A132NI91_9ACTN|nr:TadE family type IV pilus minor pilin [Carbonactinospora thermoautotrophica]KWW97510.1 hypothetical protein TH66_17985 [Carbonactinospora thermoautotrophica]KWX09736.1 hypothetical protein TR74_07815 [Carbonactinospora thermoautotrophica]MCX9191413.1 hypothetical protein [Carbonactinospora thermoautotrophica]